MLSSPTEVGTFSAWIALKDCDNKSAETLFTFDVWARRWGISTESLKSAAVGSPYSATLEGSGLPSDVTWEVTAGSLPAGLTLSPAGVIAGTASATGSSTFTVKATAKEKNFGPTRIDSKQFTLNVVALAASASRKVAEVGVRFNSTLAGSGGQSPYTFSATGTPAGLAVGSGGAISGAPTRAGSYTLNVHLVDANGSRVMVGVHPLADLAPRDVVSAAITRRMNETGTDHVFLDATHLDGDAFRLRFPTVYAACAAVGVDPAVDPIPVAPAAHFSCGGVMATVDGRTAVTGLYAAGEVARSGLHGANRLASNSLLEGLVVGSRAARAVAQDKALGLLGDPRKAELLGSLAAAVTERDVLQRTMSLHAAIGRNVEGLAAASAVLEKSTVVRPLGTRESVEDAALTMAAEILLAVAAERTESRGCHVRTDYQSRNDAAWQRSIPVRLDAAGRPFLFDRALLGGVA